MTDRRPIPGFTADYAVDGDGNIWSCKVRGNGKPPGKWHRLSPCVGNHGYRYTSVPDPERSGGYRKVLVHRMVAAAFLGECPAGLTVNHKNGNKLDNRPANLEYLTLPENTRHAAGLGLMQRGAERPLAKLTDEAVRDIRRRYRAGGIFQRELGAEYGVGQQTIQHIVSGETWRHVA
jgi:hypothetical protein